MIRFLFAVTSFLSACLLFLVQPMIGKALLPLFGGTPAVWVTCLVFFQALLLVGYFYAHRAIQSLGVRRQSRFHLLVLLLPALAFSFSWMVQGTPIPLWKQLLPSDQDFPMLPLTGLLLLAVGPAFLVLSMTAPLLQRWLSVVPGDPRDPYRLYVASNAGSFLGLLAFPFLVEPFFDLDTQKNLWSLGVCLYLILTALCGWLVSRVAEDEATPRPSSEVDEELSPRRILYWIGLSALTSGLLAGVTTHITTDIAPLPLLWVAPLGLYLLSFIIVFSSWPDSLRLGLGRIVPMLLLFLILVLITQATSPLFLVLGIPMAAFFAVCLLVHGELACDRPSPRHLTAFYLFLSLGSVAGSFFCAFLAPILFQRLGNVEYPLFLVLAALVRPRGGWSLPRWSDFLLPLSLGIITAILVLLVPPRLEAIYGSEAFDSPLFRVIRLGTLFGLPAGIAFAMSARPLRYALGLASLLLAASMDRGVAGIVRHTERNFFGTVRVTESNDGRFVRLVHGTTMHGQESTPPGNPPVPLMYYHPTGPAGRTLSALPADKRNRVGVVGLGCGALAAYARPGEMWTFFEIDPVVIRIARQDTFFSFLSSCQGEVRIVPGDARLRLELEEDHSFDVLVLDAFSSDSIPIHLLTREALELYFSKLKEDGILLFHVSNRYLDLPPLLARLAQSQSPPKRALVDHDIPSEKQEKEGKTASTWMLLARPGPIEAMRASDRRWSLVDANSGPLWTDAFSNLLGVWRREEP